MATGYGMPFARAQKATDAAADRQLRLRAQRELFTDEAIEARKQERLASTEASKAKGLESQYQQMVFGTELSPEAVQNYKANAGEKVSLEKAARTMREAFRPRASLIANGDTKTIVDSLNEMAPLGPNRRYVVNDENGWTDGLQISVEETDPATGETKITSLKGQTFASPDEAVEFFNNEILTPDGVQKSAILRQKNRRDTAAKQAEELFKVNLEGTKARTESARAITRDAMFKALLQEKGYVSVEKDDPALGGKYTTYYKDGVELTGDQRSATYEEADRRLQLANAERNRQGGQILDTPEKVIQFTNAADTRAKVAEVARQKTAGQQQNVQPTVAPEAPYSTERINPITGQPVTQGTPAADVVVPLIEDTIRLQQNVGPMRTYSGPYGFGGPVITRPSYGLIQPQ